MNPGCLRWIKNNIMIVCIITTNIKLSYNIIRCLCTMYHSSKSIVRTVFNNALYNSNSCIGYKMAYFRNTYAVDITKHDPKFVFSRVKATGTYNNIAHKATIDNLLTLLHVRFDISYIEGFDGSDIDDLIELVATL